MTGRSGDAGDCAFDVRIGGEAGQVRYKSSTPLTASGETGLAVALLPAMTQGGALDIAPAVSPRLLAAAEHIQRIFLGWDRGDAFPHLGLKPVKVEAGPRTPPAERAKGVGCFFSGGVDSFYTLLQHLDEVTDIVFVHGFDIPLDAASLRRRASDAAATVAEALGKNLVEIETDYRALAEPRLTWHHVFGAGLAAVAHLLSPRIGRMYIPGAHTWSNLVPDGSHPLLDPLWSSEDLEIVFDGCEATRTDKLALLARSELALRHLRVCWQNPGGAYNCGRCEKCVRTKISMLAVGALERCPVMPDGLDDRALARFDVRYARSLWVELARDLKSMGADARLQRIVQRVLDSRGPSRLAAAAQRGRNLLRRAFARSQDSER